MRADASRVGSRPSGEARVQEIVDALVAGAMAGGKDAASAAVADAYRGLKALVADRLADRAAARTALDEVESRVATGSDGAGSADGDPWRAVLVEELTRAGLGNDDEIAQAARRLSAVLDEAGARGGGSSDTYRVDARHSRGTVIGGRHHTVTQNFGGAEPHDPTNASGL